MALRTLPALGGDLLEQKHGRPLTPFRQKEEGGSLLAGT